MNNIVKVTKQKYDLDIEIHSRFTRENLNRHWKQQFLCLIIFHLFFRKYENHENKELLMSLCVK